MAANTVDGLLRVDMDTSGIDRKIPKTAQIMQDFQKRATQATSAIAASGSRDLAKFNLSVGELEKKLRAASGLRTKAAFSVDAGRYESQMLNRAGTPGFRPQSLSEEIAFFRNRSLVSEGKLAPVQGPVAPPHLRPGVSPAKIQQYEERLATERANAEAAEARRALEQQRRISKEREEAAKKANADIRQAKADEAKAAREAASAAYKEKQRRWTEARAQNELDKAAKKVIRDGQAQARILNAQIEKAQRERKNAEEELARAAKKQASLRQKMAADEQRDAQKIFAIQQRMAGAPADVQSQINALLTGSGSYTARMGMRNVGATRNQSFFNQMTAGGVAPGSASYLLGSGRRPPGWQPPGGAGAAGGVGGWFNRNLGRFASGIASGLGIGVAGMGGYAAIQGARAVVESTQVATAYNRQSIAAKDLAGSQEKLNALLDAYEEASGGAIAKVTEMNNVTRLLSTGFAKNADEVERFVRATRGASIALGKPEDYIIQETQLAISNTSQKRLDQIGLGIKEVNDRIEQLRETNKGWSRESAFQEAILSLMEQKYGKLTTTIEGQATGLEKLRKAWADLYLTMGQGAKGPVDAASNFLSDMLNSINETWQKRATGKRVNDLQYTLNSLSRQMGGNILSAEEYRGFANEIISNSGRDAARRSRPSRSGANTNTARFNEDQKNVIDQYYNDIQAIEKNYNKARLEETRNYEEQRTQLIADFGRTMAREEEDFLRQRARSLRDYERSITDLMRDSQERDAEMREDYEKTVAKAREDSSERIAEMEEEYNEQREEAAKDHRDALMKAAGQLDAIAVLEERKRWRREQEQAQKQHDKALGNEKENLEKRIKEAREAYEEQLEDARKADAKRLEDMRVNRERQLADEDEDRTLRLNRAKEDHDLQLEELGRQHNLRMTQIAEQAEEERAALEEAFGFALNEVGIYVAGFQAKMEERDALIEAWFNRVVDRLEREIRGEAGTDYYYDPKKGPMIPQNYTTPLASTSNVTVSGGKSVVIQPNAIVINAHPAMDEERVANYALTKMAEFLEEYDK